MPKTIVTKDALLQEIESVFPLVEMPASADLPFHQDGCYECEELRKDLEEYRNKEVTQDLFRSIHQELYHLSAKGWRWILPHYLTFSLTPAAEYSSMETEFLIFNLRPDPRFQADTYQRLAALTAAQVNCVIHFLEWCSGNESWIELADDIDRAIKFLRTHPSLSN